MSDVLEAVDRQLKKALREKDRLQAELSALRHDLEQCMDGRQAEMQGRLEAENRLTAVHNWFADNDVRLAVYGFTGYAAHTEKSE